MRRHHSDRCSRARRDSLSCGAGLGGGRQQRSEGETGVWLDVGTPFARKICAMGVRASRWVTMHGFALNVNADLGYFDNIIPCGIKGKAVTSMHVELGRAIDEDEVKEKIVKHFQFLFEALFFTSEI